MGGLLAMALGIIIPTALRGVILNDIGPEIGESDLANILLFIGRDHPQDNWDSAILVLKTMFPGITFRTNSEWRSAAEGTFREGSDGKLHIDWDPNIILPLTQRMPSTELWKLFRSLRSIPVLAFRGERSNILSMDTFVRMAEQHKNLEAITIAGAGHTPSLGEPEARSAILKFLRRHVMENE